jgi:hypothetical protein
LIVVAWLIEGTATVSAAAAANARYFMSEDPQNKVKPARLGFIVTHSFTYSAN